MNAVPTLDQLRLVVPVKGGPSAKSRLRPPTGVDRGELALALAEDTLTAVLATGVRDVVVVTGDPGVRSLARRLGAQVLADPGLGLNGAIRAGWTAATGGLDPWPVAALLGDVPALRPRALLDALHQATFVLADGTDAAFVPDAAGTGTVLLVAAAPTFEPRFGPGSAAAHARTATALPLDLPHLRQDVDTTDDLGAATELGLGSATTRVLADPSGL